jgi:hypothetical protein
VLAQPCGESHSFAAKFSLTVAGTVEILSRVLDRLGKVTETLRLMVFTGLECMSDIPGDVRQVFL